MNLMSVYQKKEDIVTRSIADETLLVPIRSQMADMQRIFALNPAAEFIWQQLDGKQKLENILEGITSNFNVEKVQAESDLQEFILQLIKEGIIEEAP
jgi:methyltransferase-like protein